MLANADQSKQGGKSYKRIIEIMKKTGDDNLRFCLVFNCDGIGIEIYVIVFGIGRIYVYGYGCAYG